MKSMESVLRLFITSRPNIDLREKFTRIVQIEISANKSDVETYLRSEIDTNRRLTSLIAREPTLKEELVHNLSAKTTGM